VNWAPRVLVWQGDVELQLIYQKQKSCYTILLHGMAAASHRERSDRQMQEDFDFTVSPTT